MRVWAALIIVAVVLVGGAAAYNQALATAGEDRSVTKEEFSNPTAGETITVSEAGNEGVYFTHEETVYDENGTQMTAGDDYEWFPENGTLRVLAGGDLAGDASGEITYNYDETTAEQQEQAQLVSLIIGNLAWIVLIAIILVFIGVARGAMQ